MNEYIKIFVVIFVVWCVYSYYTKTTCGIEGFYPYVVKWTGRDVPFKQCLNNCEGLRHHNYRDCAANCNNNDQFKKYYYLQ